MVVALGLRDYINSVNSEGILILGAFGFSRQLSFL